MSTELGLDAELAQFLDQSSTDDDSDATSDATEATANDSQRATTQTEEALPLSFHPRLFDDDWFEDEQCLVKHVHNKRKDIVLLQANAAFFKGEYQHVLALAEQAKEMNVGKGQQREWCELQAHAAAALGKTPQALEAAMNRAQQDRGYEVAGRRLLADCHFAAGNFHGESHVCLVTYSLYSRSRQKIFCTKCNATVVTVRCALKVELSNCCLFVHVRCLDCIYGVYGSTTGKLFHLGKNCCLLPEIG
eukprot:m.83676 g.83676  ORF g.83676 m.83676 type:complete len:248 (-) comp12726_c0_seq3:592-1335(-)